MSSTQFSRCPDECKPVSDGPSYDGSVRTYVHTIYSFLPSPSCAIIAGERLSLFSSSQQPSSRRFIHGVN